MLMPAIENYLEVRRALGYKLENTEWLLRSFAQFAAARGERYVVSETAVAWAGQTATAHQCDRRLKTITTLARFLHAEDERHDIPPHGIFCPQHQRPIPYIFGAWSRKPAGSLR